MCFLANILCVYIITNEANKSATAANVTSKQTKNAVESEFVSDAFQTTDKDLDEVKAGMKLLGIDSLTSQTNKNDGKTVLGANSQKLAAQIF